MPVFTQVTGFLLIGVGALSFATSGMSSILAALPALFGFPLVIYGDTAKNPAKKAGAMHVAVLVAFVGWLASLPVVYKLLTQVPDGANWPPGALISVLMCAITSVYVATSIGFFARRRLASRAT
jgi:hypothetical protein